MAEELKSSSEHGYKPIEKESPLASLEESLKTLNKVDGFKFFEGIIENIDNLNPAKKARGKIFLSEDSKKAQRHELKIKMQKWIELLSANSSVSEMMSAASAKAEASEQLIKSNLKNVLGEIHNLEEAYRSVNMFYKNTEATKVKNVSIMNASMEQIQSFDDPEYRNKAQAELNQNFNRLDMRHNYSLMVIPGSLGKNSAVDEWAKIAYDNKVMLVTDFDNHEYYESHEEILKDFEDGNYTSGAAYKSNVIMTCNALVGRGKITEVGEENDLYVPGSAALAGKMYCTNLSQPVAGITYGTIDEVDAVRFELKKTDISELENVGLVPFVGEWGKVMPFSAKTLYNGSDQGMQMYSIVRVFDFAGKVVSDFLNRKTFNNWNGQDAAKVRQQIVDFFDSIKGPGKVIENFKIGYFEQDGASVSIDVELTPFFATKSFLVKFERTREDEGWNKGAASEKK